MTSNDVSGVMGQRIELGQDRPAVGGGRLEVMAAPLPRTSFNDDVAALDRTRVSGLVVVAAHKRARSFKKTSASWLMI